MKRLQIVKLASVKVAILAMLAIIMVPSLASAAAPLQSLGQAADATDLAQLSNDNLNGAVKEEIMRRMILRQIAQNTAQQIVTDVTVVDLEKSYRPLVSYNENTPHFAASVNKLPVAWLTLQDLRAGKFRLSDMVTWMPSDVRGGEGLFDQPGAPTQATVQDVIFDMLNRSGNTAVRILTNYKLGLAATVNARLDQYPQIPQTRLQPLADDPTRFFLGNTTSRESLWILGQLLKKKDAPEQFMEQALITDIYSDIGVKSQLAGNDYIVLANKIGLLNDSDGYNRHDVGLIYNTRTHKTYGYSFLTTTPAGVSDVSVPQAENSLKKMGRALLTFAGDKRHSIEGGAQTQTAGPTQHKADHKVLY